MANQDPPLNCLDPVSISEVPTQTFSVELQTCRITDKGVDLQVVKVDHVLSYLCVCSECGKGFPAKSSLMVHRQIHVEHWESAVESKYRSISTATGKRSSEAKTVESPISADQTAKTRHTPDNESTIINKHPARNIQPTVEVSNDVAGKMPSERSADKPECHAYQLSQSQQHSKSKSDQAINSSITIIKVKRGRPKAKTRKEATGKRVQIDDNVADIENADIADLPETDSLADHEYQKHVQPGNRDGLTCSADDISEDHELSQCDIDSSSRRTRSGTPSTSPRRKCRVIKPAHSSGSEDIRKNLNLEVEKSTKIKKEHKPFKCDTCGKTYRTNNKQHILDHQNVHLDLKPYVCTLCDTAFAVKAQLREHVWMHKTGGGIPCEICGIHSRSQSALKIHMDVHTGIKRHQCTVCGKLYARQGNLNAHMRTHTGEKPYACTICGKSFTQASILQDHEATHIDAQLLCPYCGKQFKQRSSLRPHIRAQHGGNPVTCAICGKVFKDKSYLRRHYNSHKKAHTCSICGKSYCRRHKMISHMKKHHTGDRPFKCTRCDQAFRSLDILKTHLDKTHEESNTKIQSVEIESSIIRHFEDGQSAEIEGSIVRHFVDGQSAEFEGSILRHFEDGQSAEIETSIVQHIEDCSRPDVEMDSQCYTFC